LLCVVRQATVNEVNGLAHRVKNDIQLLDEMNAHALRQRGHGVGSASERTRTSITAGAKAAALCVGAGNCRYLRDSARSTGRKKMVFWCPTN
jgi:hypothetical protein